MPIQTPKILHVIARFNIGGTARYLAFLLPELSKNDVNTLLAVGGVQEGEVEDSSLKSLNFIRIESLGRRINLREDLKSYVELRRVIRQYNPDLIHTHTFKAGFLCRLMYFGTPKVHTFHGHLLADPEFSKLQKKLIVHLEKFLSTITSKLIVTGNQVALDLQAVGVGKPHQFISIDGQNPQFDAVPREIARKKLGISTQFTILWLARVVSVKNPSLLLEVARLMPECKFLMAGDGIELDHVRTMASENVKVLGFVDAKEIVLAADVFLSTSLNEGIPYSILEAQSVFLPVVAVKAGALSEIIEDGVNGYLVEPNVEEIVSKIRKLQTSPELIESMKSSLRDISLRNQSEPSFSSEHIELYKEVLNRK